MIIKNSIRSGVSIHSPTQAPSVVSSLIVNKTKSVLHEVHAFESKLVEQVSQLVSQFASEIFNQ